MPIYYGNKKVSGTGLHSQSINKLGNVEITGEDANIYNIDLSDPDACIFGTPENPITINEVNPYIRFIGFEPIDGFQKQFILCIQRTGGPVTWDMPVQWMPDGEIPLLPLNRPQLIYFSTESGATFYGIGDVYV